MRAVVSAHSAKAKARKKWHGAYNCAVRVASARSGNSERGQGRREGKSKVSMTRRVLAYKHERKRIVGVRVRVRRRTGGVGGLSEGREWGPVVSSRVRVRVMVGASCRRRFEVVVVDSEEEARGRVGEGMSSSSQSG